MATPTLIPEALASDGKVSAYGKARSTIKGAPLSAEELRKVDAYWRASLYLSLGMLYLKDNPLLKEPLKLDHTKPRLLGHWGSDAGQSFTYTHFNRLINKYDLNAIFISAPRTWGAGRFVPRLLEGTYSEIYPDKSEDVAGMQRFFKQFSFPGGIGSNATPETPGSIHEGGELGYSISHAFGTAFDHPDLITLVIVGDGESETGPLATSWHSNKFLNPITDGAVLPVLHLNGYKINNPTVPARISHEELEALFVGYGYTPYFVEGSDPGKHAPSDGRHLGALRRGDSQGAGGGTADGQGLPTALAHDHPPQPQRLDGSAAGGRALPGGFLAGAPDSADRHRHQPRPPESAGNVDAQLQTGETL
jgi:xylulose-5-phosphate/fructose-6-phosphate phosphoketolase